MKLRKLAALTAAAAIGLSLAAPAMAAEAADARLTRVTLAVKETLAIGDEYTEFYGEPDETPLGTRWELNWEGGEERLNVTASDEGKVLSLYRMEEREYPVYYEDGYGPSFPSMTRAQAAEKARVFLDKIFSANEKAVFTENEEASLSAQDYSFRGGVELNGLPSPMTFYVRVRLSDGEVTRFWRGDPSDYAGTPGEAKTSTTADKAREQLRTTLSLRLEYVRDAEQELAVLRYLPNSTHEFYVDAATGELVDLTELRAKLNRDYDAGNKTTMDQTMAEMAAPGEAAAGLVVTLSDTELAGVAKLEDVLDKEALDKKIRAWSELGLKDYTLGSASYSVDRETGEVTARVSYARNSEEGIYRRYITVNAKTGELMSMYGSNPYRAKRDGVKYLSVEASQEKGKAFLTRLWGSQFAKTEIYNAPDGEADTTLWSFTFAQKVNGYFFLDNSLTVRVDAADGSIMGFSRSFDEDVSFDSAVGIISEAAAIDAWCATFPVELGYMEVPVALDMDEEFELLRNAGYNYYNALKPGYALGDREVWYLGVDAKTGEPVKSESQESEKMAYDDLSGHWAEELFTELAQYQVGWLGGKAKPNETLTQKDYIILLASADGWRFNGGEEEVDSLYDYAIRRGLLKKEERQEDQALTRGEMVKLLLNSLGYGPVANLSGIFRCDFADAAQLSNADLGYAALAQGLGLISGDAAGNYAPTRTALRCEAAAMLWKYMKR